MIMSSWSPEVLAVTLCNRWWLSLYLTFMHPGTASRQCRAWPRRRRQHKAPNAADHGPLDVTTARPTPRTTLTENSAFSGRAATSACL